MNVNYHRKFFLFAAIFTACLFACQKDKVNHKHARMIGDWYHCTGVGLYYSIWINENGRGSIYEVNATDDGLDTQSRAWLIKDDKLIFSRFKREQFSIDAYPDIATSTIIDNFDTIPAGKTFMILDGHYFRKKE